MEWIYIIASLVCLIITVIYTYFKYCYAYWRARGIPHDKPTIPFGNAKEFGKTVHAAHFTKKLYDKYKPTTAKFCGAYFFTRPIAILLDLDLVRSVLVKDFANFNDRGFYRKNIYGFQYLIINV